MQFKGSLEELKALVAELDVPCRWQHRGVFEMAIFEDEVSNLKLNWWPATGQLQVVGDPEVREGVVEKLTALLNR
jgi:hypothetical protein